MDLKVNLKINKAGCKILGYTEAEILYQSFETFYIQRIKLCFSDILQDKGEKTPPPLKIDFTRRRVKLFPYNGIVIPH
jgi:hypothetical protein